MANLEYKNLIRFVKEGKEEEVAEKEEIVETNLDGNQVRAFYEELIQNDSNKTSVKKESRGRQRKNKSQSRTSEKKVLDSLKSKKAKSNQDSMSSDLEKNETRKQSCETYDTEGYISDRLSRLGNEFLKHAQQGNLDEMKKLSTQGVNVDHSDGYGWTALMCAGIAGHENVVEYLLKHGANKSLVNNQGKTAAQLAEGADAMHVVELIENFDEKRKGIIKNHNKNISQEVFCEICKCEFVKSSPEDRSHYSSTVHLFNLKLEPKPDPFMISEVNVGYQMMRQSGWDGERGLGPKGEGHKYPVRTTLKTDRSCLGSTERKSKAKVTHYGPNDPNAVNSYQRISQRVMSVRTVSRRERQRKEKKAIEWEKNLRWEMNMN